MQDEPREKQVSREKHINLKRILMEAEASRMVAKFLIWQPVDGDTIHRRENIG